MFKCVVTIYVDKLITDYVGKLVINCVVTDYVGKLVTDYVGKLVTDCVQVCCNYLC